MKDFPIKSGDGPDPAGGMGEVDFFVGSCAAGAEALDAGLAAGAGEGDFPVAFDIILTLCLSVIVY